jgi:DhnA family fructose-bisphosphate aldolase class Ia
MQRLFDGNLDSGNVLICAVDHGMFQGVPPGLQRLEGILEKVRVADAVLMGPGMIEHYRRFFYTRSAPLLISRLGFTSAYCFPWGYREGHTGELFTPSYLQAQGADIVVCSLQLKTGSQAIDTANAEVWGKVVMEKERIGLPLIGEFHPTVYEEVDRDEWQGLIGAGCRILCELGADMIKTFYTDERFSEIAASVPIPIFILGSRKLPGERDILELTERALRSGARGVAIGRNIFQAREPEKTITALRAVIKQGASAAEAAEAAGLL